MLMIFTSSINLAGKIKEPAENVLPAGFVHSGYPVSVHGRATPFKIHFVEAWPASCNVFKKPLQDILRMPGVKIRSDINISLRHVDIYKR
jgi:hypothetical protein